MKRALHLLGSNCHKWHTQTVETIAKKSRRERETIVTSCMPFLMNFLRLIEKLLMIALQQGLWKVEPKRCLVWRKRYKSLKLNFVAFYSRYFCTFNFLYTSTNRKKKLRHRLRTSKIDPCLGSGGPRSGNKLSTTSTVGYLPPIAEVGDEEEDQESSSSSSEEGANGSRKTIRSSTLWWTKENAEQAHMTSKLYRYCDSITRLMNGSGE